jgi:dynactin complex subunit
MTSPVEEEERLKSLVEFQEGDRVFIQGTNRRAVVRFIGLVPFAQGLFAGLELSAAEGRNNGTVDGIRYFTCKPKHGLFVRAASVVPEAQVLNKQHKGEGVNEDVRHTHLSSGTPIAKNYSSPSPKSASKLLSSSVKSTPRSKVSVFKGNEQSVDTIVASPAFREAVSEQVLVELRDVKERLRKCEEENASLRAALDKQLKKGVKNLAESEEAFRVISELCKNIKAQEKTAA